MKDMFITGKFLFITCTIAAVLLSFTEIVTKPLILQHAIEKKAKARGKVLSNATKFSKEDLVFLEKNESGETATHSIGLGYDSSGKCVGMVKEVFPKGFAGPIEIVIGLSFDKRITGVEITKMNETPGLGTKLKEGFLKKFVDLCKEKGSNLKIKLKKDGGDVDGITAATVSSRAFCKGVSEGISFFERHLKEIESKSNSSVPLEKSENGGAK